MAGIREMKIRKKTYQFEVKKNTAAAAVALDVLGYFVAGSAAPKAVLPSPNCTSKPAWPIDCLRGWKRPVQEPPLRFPVIRFDSPDRQSPGRS